MNRYNLFATICLTVIFIACRPSGKESILISGSTTVLPIVSRAAEIFKTTGIEANIIVNTGGSGVGINLVGAGTIQIGMASRDITRQEIEKYPGVKFVAHTIGKDAVVPVVSSEIYAAGVTALTLRQIAAIYIGEIQNWRELGGPDKEILVIDKEKARGTRHVFMQAILGDKEADAPGADLVLGSNNEEQTAIIQSDAAIGMLSHAWMNEDVKGLSIIRPDGTAITPALENIVSGTFPITRDLLLITAGEPRGIVKTFIDFIKSPEGQKIVEESGYVSIYK